MKIIYDRNPLHVKIYLDDKEKEIFKWKYIAQQLEDDLFSVEHYLTYYTPPRIDNALIHCKGIEEKEKYVESMIGALTEQHIGDCTAFPCSCEKCWAESVLGVSTRPPSKMIGNALFYAFQELSNSSNITEDVLTLLKERQAKHAEYIHVVEYFQKYSIEYGHLLA